MQKILMRHTYYWIKRNDERENCKEGGKKVDEDADQHSDEV